MPKVSLIKIYNIQSKQNRTCSLDDIIKENIKNYYLKSIYQKLTILIYQMITLYLMIVKIKMKLMKLIILPIMMKLIF